MVICIIVDSNESELATFHQTGNTCTRSAVARTASQLGGYLTCWHVPTYRMLNGPCCSTKETAWHILVTT